jgi:hypothetical protein
MPSGQVHKIIGAGFIETAKTVWLFISNSIFKIVQTKTG